MLKEVEDNIHRLKEDYNVLRKKRHDEFMLGFNVISAKLKEMY